ncbi:50S ribosomal protein L23 [Patescibacteria group bacterium]|nr:50S ribosomal protein L23 [Patescibacteria group bacterium]MBU0776793.1 50S ribosomal protein L23 [Patescibacteria group bacterium]MBU0845632.1 50S ribosomal protein L23 [Patescibacteria group bacterium]MBU0922674.1 50S ribosomal protein L23 [Patescibacteria group bacterium]MBU1066725.1 50S ribosomal protein L23 [Patescibacteria group bacterium]
MKLRPVLTEKSMSEAKKGNYTFFVERNMNKRQIRKMIEDVFGVKVVKVRTMNIVGEVRRTNTGKKRTIKPKKKAIVTLEGKDKIDLFGEVKK